LFSPLPKHLAYDDDDDDDDNDYRSIMSQIGVGYKSKKYVFPFAKTRPIKRM